jgi:hypothetical protein
VGAFARLRDKRFNGYLAYRVPHELDSVVDAAVSAYRSGSEDARRQLTGDLNADVAAVLSVYGERMAVLAVRTRSVEPLRRGLVGMGLAEGVLDDYRDNLIVLAAVNHSADTVGIGLTKLIDDVKADLSEPALARFRDFAQWRDDEKSLHAMGWRTKGEGDSFRYVSG